MMRMKMHIRDDISSRDIHVLRGQLARDDVNAAGILQRCCHGFPSVIVLHPSASSAGSRPVNALNFTSVATPLWLTCPHLNERIHRLESEGYVKKIENYIGDNIVMDSRMCQAHVSYAFMRKNIYKKYFHDMELMEKYGATFGAGIGGIRKPGSVKCLHLHVAHHAACKDNIVGEITLGLLRGDEFCREVKCKNVYDK